MDQVEITSFYKLNELEQILVKCEADISNRIDELKLKEADDNLNFLLYTIGKCFVATREIILLCWSGLFWTQQQFDSCLYKIGKYRRQ